jgi:hypothetical protein
MQRIFLYDPTFRHKTLMKSDKRAGPSLSIEFYASLYD